MKQTHIKLTSRKRFNKGRWMEYWHIGVAMFWLVPKKGNSRQRFQQKLGYLTSLARHPRLAASCSSFHFQRPPSISRGRDALELRLVRGWAKTDMSPRKDRISSSQGTEKGFATKFLDKTELCGENKIGNEAVRRHTSLLLAPLLQRGPWGPCWKFDIALGCLKLQGTEFYLCSTGTNK